MLHKSRSVILEIERGRDRLFYFDKGRRVSFVAPFTLFRLSFLLIFARYDHDDVILRSPEVATGLRVLGDFVSCTLSKLSSIYIISLLNAEIRSITFDYEL